MVVDIHNIAWKVDGRSVGNQLPQKVGEKLCNFEAPG
jgi:hypothetical protein